MYVRINMAIQVLNLLIDSSSHLNTSPHPGLFGIGQPDSELVVHI